MTMLDGFGKPKKIGSIASKLQNFDSILSKLLRIEKFLLDYTREKEPLSNRLEFQR